MRNRLTDLETVGIAGAETWLEDEPIAAPSNYKDPEKIAAYIVEATAKRLERFALDPDLCRIVALGYWDIGEGDPTVVLCRDDHEERQALDAYWASYRQRYTRIIGFNSARFDLVVLLMRSLYLGSKAPEMQIAPAWKSHHVDLYERLSLGGARKDVKSLRFYAKRFGIPIYDDISGKDVAAAVKAGEWDKVTNHCLFDLDLTRALAERMGVIPATVEQAEDVHSIF